MRVRGIGMAITLATAVVLAGSPPAAGAASVSTSRTITVHAVSLDCVSHGVAGCVNVAVDVTWSDASQSGRLCIDVNDYRTPAPVPSYGCTELGPGAVRLLRRHVLAVAPQVVTTTASDDCYRADPDEGCVPRTFSVVAGVTAAPLGNGVTTIGRPRPTGCVAKAITRTTVYAADVRVQVDAFDYRMPSAAPLGARNSAVLVIDELRAITRC